jgi:HPt (histidine-containing phosphotransfer) domain-containing protein
MTGGTLDGYLKVLAMFRKDAEERLELLRSFADQSRPGADAQTRFVTQVHALKSASASLGAAEVSAEAARLEASGKAGDLAAIRETLPGFLDRLAALAEAIGNALAGEERAAPQAPSTPPPPVSLLDELAAALEAQKADDIDRALEELLRRDFDAAARETIDQISDNVLMAEYGKALEAVKKLGQR